MSSTMKYKAWVAPRERKDIRVDDVYLLAERERIRSSYKNRRHVLAQAQNDIRHDDGLSRPLSSRSHFVSKTGSLVSGVRSRQSSAHSTVKPNTPDGEVEVASTVHCCEVMGPAVCQLCRKTSSRASHRDRTDASFPNLRVTQQNITTSALVERLYPQLSTAEIHTKIARGEIARTHLPKTLSSAPNTRSEASRTAKHNVGTIYTIARLKQRFKNKGAPTTPMFFHNIRDLNYKIQTGKIPRELGFDKLVPSFSGERSVDEACGSTTSILPVFVSPRKVTMYKEPSYKTYFAPPLLPRESQKPEPSFFAGSNFEYRLPERLPDKLVFMDSVKGRLNSALSMTSMMSDDTQDSGPTLPEKGDIPEEQ